jgi:ADP-ribose pyrophosphatase YjhB (NUDIX family)
MPRPNRTFILRTVDAAIRLALRLAYPLARLWWRVRRPPHVGALVALWHEDRLLLVRPSYRGSWSLPGGGVRDGETPEAAARREVAEELGLEFELGPLRLAYLHHDAWEGRPDTVHVFEAHIGSEPEIAVDHREIVAAEFVAPDRAVARRLPPHLRGYLAHCRLAGLAGLAA